MKKVANFLLVSRGSKGALMGCVNYGGYQGADLLGSLEALGSLEVRGRLRVA